MHSCSERGRNSCAMPANYKYNHSISSRTVILSADHYAVISEFIHNNQKKYVRPCAVAWLDWDSGWMMQQNQLNLPDSGYLGCSQKTDLAWEPTSLSGRSDIPCTKALSVPHPPAGSISTHRPLLWVMHPLSLSPFHSNASFPFSYVYCDELTRNPFIPMGISDYKLISDVPAKLIPSPPLYFCPKFASSSFKKI